MPKPIPPVSVCIPTYNGEAFVRQCIESVLAQSFPDFELIVVDDGSTDGTWDIVRDYEARDCRFRVSRNEVNKGLVGNWNHCVDVATGRWLKFVFQDDELAPECLAR